MIDFSYFVQVAISLGILTAFLYGFYRISKTVQKHTFSGDIKIVDRKPIDSNATLLIVEVKNKEYLLSVGTKEVTLLEKL